MGVIQESMYKNRFQGMVYFYRCGKSPKSFTSIKYFLMAKADFWFPFYVGDAASDMAHMPRLCRGAYVDLMALQHKIGHMSISRIKMVLGDDFDFCWQWLEIILKIDAEGLFCNEWLETSITRMKANSKAQKANINKRWAKEGEKDTKPIPNVYHGTTMEIPLEDGNGDGNENRIEDVGKGVQGKGKTKNELPKLSIFDFTQLSALQIGSTIEFIAITSHVQLTHERTAQWFEAFKIHTQDDNGKWKKYYEDVGAITDHFRNWLKTQKLTETPIFKNGNLNNPPPKNGTSLARVEALKNW